jgi:UDP-glucose 4-epimerase
MTVLVTGGAGYIGSHMLLALLDKGEDVVVVDNFSSGFAWALPRGVHLRGGDVGDKVLLKSVIKEFKVKEIVHFAAKIVVPESIAFPLMYYDTNTSRSRCLIESAVENEVERFIFSSTAAVYGNVSNEPVSEDLLPSPVSPYGRSKLITEWMLKDASEAHGLSFISLRYFNVAGADADGRAGQSSPNATHLIKVAVQAALGRRPYIEIFGTDYPTPDGTCIRDFIHVTDLVDAHIRALHDLRNQGKSKVLNCGYGLGFSVNEVLQIVEEVSGTRLPVRTAQRRPGDPPCIVAKAERVRAELGWVPRHNNLNDIVETAFRWEKSLGDRARPHI